MIVYAPSYAGLVHALKIVNSEELLVLTSNVSIKNFCEKYEIKCDYFDRFVAETRKDYIKQLDNVKLIAKKYKNEEVLFCFYSRDIFGLYLIYLLDKKNKIYFYNKDFIYEELGKWRVLNNLKYLKDLVLLKSLTKLPLTLFKLNDKQVFFGISPKKLESRFKSSKHNYISVIKNEIFKNNQNKILSKVDLDSNSIIFVDQGNSIFEVPDSIIEELKSMNKKVFVKQHPNFSISNNRLNEFLQLDKSIPLELIVTNELTLIGITSTILFDEDLVCHKKSFINKVIWKDETNKINLISQLKKVESVQII
ncbi:MAG: hypothetical protein FGM14_01025 [Flavobacteriales bacterium]|nr:hypothetical protein [Flavobacteriales bacterium]